MDERVEHWSETAKTRLGASVPDVSPSYETSRRRRGRPAFSTARVVAALAAVFALAFLGLGLLKLYNTLAGPADETIQSQTNRVGSISTYRDDTWGFSFEYPSHWQEIPYLRLLDDAAQPEALVVFADPTSPAYSGYGHDLIMVSTLPSPPDLNIDDPTLLPALLNQEIGALTTHAGDVRVIAPPSACTVNGLRGARATYRLTLSEDPVLVTTYLLIAHDRQYRITFQAGEDRWQHNGPFFDMVTASFSTAARLDGLSGGLDHN